MKNIVLFLGLSFILVTGAIGQVDTEYHKTLKKMLAMAGTEGTYKAAIKNMMSLIRQQYPNVSEEVWTELESEFLKTSLEDLTVMLVPIYQKYLSQDDLEKVIKFYETPVGKKFAKSSPLIMQESMQAGQQWGIKIGQAFMQKMQEKGY